MASGSPSDDPRPAASADHLVDGAHTTCRAVGTLTAKELDLLVHLLRRAGHEVPTG